MTITLTYDAGEAKTEKWLGMNAPAINQAGFMQFHSLDGRLVSMIPVPRVIRLDFEDNLVLVAH
mgnify:CR=1 FL=1